jgi:PAS domain S-box-containing protein
MLWIWIMIGFVILQTFVIIALGVNIVKRKRALTQEQNLLHALMDTTPDHIYFKDTACRFIRINKATANKHGLTDPAAAIGKTDFDFFTDEHAKPAYADEQEILRSGQSLVGIEEKETWLDGRETWASTTKVPIRDQAGRIVGIVGISRDITAHKHAEEEIRRLNAELEHRVEARTKELQETNAALHESLEALKRTQEQLIQTEKMAALGRLVAGVTHEMSTPIGLGVTAASHLEQETHDLESLYQESKMTRSDLEKYVQTTLESTSIILHNLQRAAQHIHSFKLIAVDQTSGEKRRFKLKEYLEEVLLSLHPKLKRTRHVVKVNCPEDLELESYPGVFSQIITNLVVNSLIHGFEHKPQGEIVLDCHRINGTIRMRYSDNGRGMSKGELSRIFEPFYTTKRDQGGSGLGLHIIYNLVIQTLHGQIECESTPGSGATFTIQIPIANTLNT